MTSPAPARGPDPLSRDDRCRNRNLVVFAGLSGTLLSREDHDWSPARQALAVLARDEIPLVIASSETRAEIEAWRSRLENHDPFISESGGALYVPPGTTPRPMPLAGLAGAYHCVRFGAAYPRLRGCLRLISRGLGVRLRGFGDMGTLEIGLRTGLSGEESALARQRDHDEPFAPRRPLTAEEEGRLQELAHDLGLRVTRGARFYHLIGTSSMGAAARLLISAYESCGEPVSSLGLGDGPNDLELLRVVDKPVVVARPDGTHDPELREALPWARFTRGIGPAGFNEAVLEYLGQAR